MLKMLNITFSSRFWLSWKFWILVYCKSAKSFSRKRSFDKRKIKLKKEREQKRSKSCGQPCAEGPTSVPVAVASPAVPFFFFLPHVYFPLDSTFSPATTTRNAWKNATEKQLRSHQRETWGAWRLKLEHAEVVM